MRVSQLVEADHGNRFVVLRGAVDRVLAPRTRTTRPARTPESLARDPAGRNDGAVTELRLLGPLEVHADDPRTPIDQRLGGAKQRGVLAQLALSTPRPVRTDQLIDGLWADDPPPTARNAVQVYVTGLRKVLVSQGFSLDRAGDSYVLRGEGNVDVSRFAALASAGRAALRTGRHERAAEVLTEALSLWHGRPLDGLDALPFVATARAALEEDRVSALRDLATANLRLGRFDESVRVAEAVLREHPYDETAWSTLVLAHYHAGRQEAALATCRQVRQVLLDDLGVDPTPALAELEGQVLRHEVPKPSAAGDSVADGGRPPELPPLPSLPPAFVGRGALIDQIQTSLQGGSRLVTLTGLGGMGKTTLAVALAHRLRESGSRVVFCPLETEVDAASAFARACRLVGVEPGEDPVSALGGGFDGVVLLDNAEQVKGLPAEIDRILVQHASPSLLVTSRRPLGTPSENVVAVPGLTTSSDLSTDRTHSATAVSTPEAVELFVAVSRRVGGNFDAKDSFSAMEQLCVMLEGIPLAIELAATRTRTLTPDQLLERLGDRRVSLLHGPGDGGPRARQASLAAVLDDTTRALSAQALRLLEVLGSVEGWVSFELLEEAAGEWVGGEVLSALDELVVDGLAVADGGRVRLRTPVRDYAHSLGPRNQLDAGIDHAVLALAERHGPTLDGRQAPRALELLRRDEDSLLTALNRSSEDRAEVAVRLIRAAHRYWLLTGRLAEAVITIDRVLAIPALARADRAWLDVLAGTYQSYLEDTGTAHRLAAALQRAADLDLPPDRVHVNGWCTRAAGCAIRDEYDLAELAFRRAKALAARSAEPALEALVNDLEGFLASHTGDHERALEATLRSLEDARRSGDVYALANLLVMTADNLTQLGRTQEGAMMADEAVERAVESGNGIVGLHALLARGTCRALLGEVAQGEGDLLEALGLGFERYPHIVAVADALFTLGACAAARHRDEEAARRFGAAAALYEDHGVDPTSRTCAAVVALQDDCRHRLGEAYRSLAALGQADPQRVIHTLLS